MSEQIEPEADAIDIGGDHKITYTEYEGEPAGIVEWHKKADGQWCRGWVPFRQSAWGRGFENNPGWQGWDVVQREPLTLSPSILCRACGSHGFIREGKWVQA